MKSVKNFVSKFFNYSEEVVHYQDDVKVYFVPFTNSNNFEKNQR